VLPQRRTALVSIAAAALLVVVKLVAGLATGSLGLISEAVHSGTDLVADGDRGLSPSTGIGVFTLTFDRAPGWGWTGDVHDLVANYVMLTLVGLHVLAGLYHYFIRRDGVLQRMLPGG